MQDFRKLLVWRRAHDLAVMVFRETAVIPRGHGDLVSQVRRATASVGANIAEGAQRTTSAQFANFLGIALASLAESHNHLLLLRDTRLLPVSRANQLLAHVERLRPMLLKLHTRVQTGREPPTPSRVARVHPQPQTHDTKP